MHKKHFSHPAFTLIEQFCPKSTTLRPQGRTSRLPQANSSHLHIFTQSAFTLIELAALIRTIPRTGIRDFHSRAPTLEPPERE